MKKIRFCFLLLVAVSLGFTAKAQVKSVPAETNVRNAQYPRIQEDGRGVFRIRVPEAKSVILDLGRKYDMTQGENGIWEVTTDSLSEGIHYYSMIVDGVAVADPASESFYGMSRMASGFEVPFKGGDYYAVKNVPHGEIRMKRYYSTVFKAWRRFFVYVPAGYDQSTTKYPVLYLLHGGGEDERGWSQQGKTDLIMDNLIAGGKAKQMLIVMPDGNVSGSGFNSGSFYELFDKELNECVIPAVESAYRVDAAPRSRALAGLSMGGLQTLHVGIRHPEKFTSLGVFSSGWFAGPDENNADLMFLKNSLPAFKAANKLFWIAMGGQEDIAYKNGQEMLKKLDAVGVAYQYSEYPGGHTWPVWRNNLYRFAQLLFK